MAGVTALRDAARAAILSAGGRGFVRFLSQGDALLISDAPRRGESGPLIAELGEAGFDGVVREDLLYITPGETLLLELCARQPEGIDVDWNGPLFETMALCERLLGEAPMPLDEGAGQLLMETVRLLWQPEEKVLAGLPALRARIAVRLREGKRSGLHEAGRLLAGWLEENEQ